MDINVIANTEKHGRPSCNEEESHAILDRYADLGGNFIDTADVYQFGKSEEIIGRWLKKQQREKFVIATKCRYVIDPSDPNSGGASRKHIFNSLENSLRRLGTDYVDIFYIHFWDDAVSVEESLSALNDLLRMGKIRYLGVSNTKGWQLQKFVEVSKHRQWEPLVCLQQQYSLLCRSPEWEVTEVCQNEGLGFLPWSPLKGGWLSGKVNTASKTPGAGTRMEWAGVKEGRAKHSHPDWSWFADNPQVWKVLETLEKIATEQGKSVAQVSLRWLLQKKYVPSVIIGVRTLDQLEDCMGAATGWSITEQQMASLDEVSDIPAPYPYDYIPPLNVNRQRP